VKKKKLFNIMLILIVAITLVGVITFVVLMKFSPNAKAKDNSIDTIVQQVVPVKEITTNLLDTGYIRISFTIETDSKKAKEELNKRDFQVQNIIIEELSEMKSTDFRGKKGIVTLESNTMNQVNKLMQEGRVTQVYITSFILQ
jgi:flagellar FliL protein